MNIKDFLAPTDVVVELRAADKARLLEDLSRRAAARLGLDGDQISREILKREGLGSTGTGAGVAVPHARVDGVRKPLGLLARLQRAIAFDAIDDKPVDVVFLLLLPTTAQGEQLNALACVARKLRQPDTMIKLRQAKSNAEMYRIMTADS